MDKNKEENDFDSYFRLKDILKLFPVSRQTWYNGIKRGNFPKPIKWGTCSFWRKSEILKILNNLQNSYVPPTPQQEIANFPKE